MAKYKTIGIRSLKAHLSSVMREAALGVRYLITDRDQVVAELSRPNLAGSDIPEGLKDFVVEGTVQLAKQRKKYSKSTINVPSGTVAQLISELRQD